MPGADPSAGRWFIPVNVYRALAILALSLHFLWIVWVVLGWLFTRRRPLLRWLHIGSLLYSILIELLRWPCPLTLVEVWLERQAGGAAYREPFLVHYLERLVYPELPEVVVSGVAVAVCLLILAIYVQRYRYRRTPEW